MYLLKLHSWCISLNLHIWCISWSYTANTCMSPDIKHFPEANLKKQEDELVSSLIWTSHQPHRITSGRTRRWKTTSKTTTRWWWYNYVITNEIKKTKKTSHVHSDECTHLLWCNGWYTFQGRSPPVLDSCLPDLCRSWCPWSTPCTGLSHWLQYNIK